MQTATGLLRTDKFGSSVYVENITPAEAAILRSGHTTAANGEPWLELAYSGDIKVSPSELMADLKRKYLDLRNGSDNVVDKLYPGMNPSLPETFDRVDLGCKVSGLPKKEVPVEPEVKVKK